MSSSTKRILSLCAATILPAMASDCGSTDTAHLTNDFEADPSPLAAYASFTPWSMPIPVCFINNVETDAGTDKRFSDVKDATFGALKDGWGQAPGVSFEDKGSCTDPAPANYLKITLKWDPTAKGGWGHCGVGAGASCEIGGNTGAADSTNASTTALKWVTVHEVGHALGLIHEHQRPDAVNCNGTSVNACIQCDSLLTAHQTCPVDVFNTCNETGVCTITVPLTEEVAKEVCADLKMSRWDKIRGNIANNGPIADAKLLTAFDPHAIVSYCSESRFERWLPDPLDLLGVEVIYARAPVHPLGCGSGCFYSSNGVITRRSSGSITTDWTARGAWGVQLYDPSGKLATSISAQALPAGSSSQSFRFKVPLVGVPPVSPTTLRASGTVVNSDAMYTALLMTID
jgi:hypothetical protein